MATLKPTSDRRSTSLLEQAGLFRQRQSVFVRTVFAFGCRNGTHMVKRKIAQGFTLVELMVTLTIAAILLSLAVPSLASFVQSTRLRGSSNELATALMFARSEAIKRGHAVTVCKSANSSALNPSCGISATWQQGWLVFVDHDKDGVVDGSSTPTDLVLRVGSPDVPGLAVTPASNFKNYIQYTSNGVSVGSDKLADGSLSMCLNSKSQVLTIGTTGRLSISSGVC